MMKHTKPRPAAPYAASHAVEEPGVQLGLFAYACVRVCMYAASFYLYLFIGFYLNPLAGLYLYLLVGTK